MDNGNTNQISIGKETTYGTPVVPTLSLPISASDGIQIKQEVVGVEAIKGTPAKNKTMFLGKQSFEGGFDLGVYPHSIGYLLLSVLGNSSEETIETDTVFKHTFSESATKPGLTVEQAIGDIVKRYAGYVPTKLKLSSKVGELINVNVSGNAKAQADATKITGVFETLRPFNWGDIKTLSIGGTDIKAKVDSFELEYDNGVEMFYGLGSITPAGSFSKQSTAKGKIECFVDDITLSYLSDLINGTQKEIIIDIQGDDIGATSNTGLKITLSKCSLIKFETKLGYGYNALSLEFDTSEDLINGLIKIELTNGVSSY